MRLRKFILGDVEGPHRDINKLRIGDELNICVTSVITSETRYFLSHISSVHLCGELVCLLGEGGRKRDSALSIDRIRNLHIKELYKKKMILIGSSPQCYYEDAAFEERGACTYRVS